MSRRSYLDDFKKNGNGQYEYTGRIYGLTDYKNMGLKLAVLCFLCLSSVIGSGFVNAAGLSNTFYGWLFASRGKIQLLQPHEAIDDF